MGSVYEAHREAHRRSKTEALKTEPLKPNLYKIYDRLTSPKMAALLTQPFGWKALTVSQEQWESEYWTSMTFQWSKVVWSPNGLVFEFHLNTGLSLFWHSFKYRAGNWMVVWIPDHHLNTRHKNTEQVKAFYSDVCDLRSLRFGSRTQKTKNDVINSHKNNFLTI